jgi:hypothetical protein
MKKQIILLIIALSLNKANAQDSLVSSKASEKHVGIGMRYGLGINTISSNNTGGVFTATLASLLNFGFMIEGDITKKFSIQPEMQFVQKGFSATSMGGTTINARFNYLGFNLLPKLKFGNDEIELFFLTGPSLNFNLSANASDGNRTAEIQDVAGSEFGVIFGGGLASGTKAGKFFFDVRYNLGLSDISDETPKTSTDKLNQLAISIGYIFNVN